MTQNAAEKNLNKKVILSAGAPSAIGTYSQAIQVGQFVFISGQIPLDPLTMEMIEGDFESRARRVFDNLKAIVQEAGGELDQIVKLTIYLTDLSNFSTVNNVMMDYFRAPYPARAALGVASLPKGADVEAEAILAM